MKNIESRRQEYDLAAARELLDEMRSSKTANPDKYTEDLCDTIRMISATDQDDLPEDQRAPGAMAAEGAVEYLETLGTELIEMLGTYPLSENVEKRALDTAAFLDERISTAKAADTRIALLNAKNRRSVNQFLA